ncbi:MAG: hypothetical protein Kow00109_26850 [Acidobacteriota bacterium]
MIQRRWVRGLLLLIIIGAAGLLVASYWWRSSQRQPPPPATVLPQEVRRFTTEFEYRQINEDRVVFVVRAEQSATTADGLQRLEKVRVDRVPATGEVTDWIEGRGARYDIERKRVVFQGDVVIRMRDGTSIRADEASADLAREIVYIPGGFHLERANQSGWGADLEYRIRNRRLLARGGLHLSIQEPEREIVVEAEEVEYPLAEGVIRLRRRASIGSGDQAILADGIAVRLDENNRPGEVTATERGQVLLGPETRFEGYWIRWQRQDVESRVAYLDVVGRRERSRLVEPARAFDRTAGTPSLLEGEKMRVVLRSEGVRPWLGVQRDELRADGSVRVRDVAGGRFRAGGEHLLWRRGREGAQDLLVLSESVELERRTPSRSEGVGEVVQVLQCSRIELALHLDGVVETARVVGPTVGLQRSVGTAAQLTTQSDVVVDFARGEPVRAGVGGPLEMELRRDGGRNARLEAGQGTFEFGAGRLERFRGEGNTRFVWEDSERRLESRGRRLAAEFGAEGWRRIEQRGEGEARMRAAGREAVIRGNLLIFDAAAHRLSVPEESGGETVPSVHLAAEGLTIGAQGRRLSFDWIEERLDLVGRVRGTGTTGDSTVGFFAERLQWSAAGPILLEGAARLVRAEQMIQAEWVALHHGLGGLEAKERVEFTTIDSQAGEAEVFRIRSQAMEVSDDGRRAEFRGEVVVDGPGLRLEAPRVSLEFTAAGGAARHVVAEGGVRVWEAERSWEAPRVRYDRETGQVVAQ